MVVLPCGPRRARGDDPSGRLTHTCAGGRAGGDRAGATVRRRPGFRSGPRPRRADRCRGRGRRTPARGARAGRDGRAARPPGAGDRGRLIEESGLSRRISSYFAVGNIASSRGSPLCVARPLESPMSSPSAQFSLTLRVELDRRPGMLGEVATAIGEAGGSIGDIETIELGDIKAIREMTVDAVDAEHGEAIAAAVEAVDGASL